MALIDLWKGDRDQITSKRIDQLIAFAGDGQLRDGNDTSAELRDLLKLVSSDILGRWLDDCLEVKFDDFGLVLQDVTNEVGRRLGFEVTHGFYRGHGNEGYDGLWRLSDDRAILVESKSSTAYSIDLNRIAKYRNQVAPHTGLPAEDISILIVVGAEDTSSFEAQVRGSRFAWDIRLIGVRSLFRLLKLKESLDDPKVGRQIQAILFPQEFTRLDGIIDLVFATAEDSADADDERLFEDIKTTNSAPRAKFHSDVLARLEKHFGKPLVKRSRLQWATPEDDTLVSCQVSKKFEKGGWNYWFGLRRTMQESLEEHPNSYCAFGLGSAARVVLMPYRVIAPYLAQCFTSPDDEGGIRHWHIRFIETPDGVAMLIDRDRNRLDVTQFLVSD